MVKFDWRGEEGLKIFLPLKKRPDSLEQRPP